MKALHKMLIEGRRDRNASIYRMVSAWCKLQDVTDFWEQFGFQSEDAYLQYFGLPEGRLLGRWMVMVKLFDKPAFLEVVRKYVEKKYERVVTKEGGGIKQTTRALGRHPQRLVLRQADTKQEFGPKIEEDFAIKQTPCPRCLQKDRLLHVFKTYVEQLEGILKGRNLRLPPRPTELAGILK